MKQEPNIRSLRARIEAALKQNPPAGAESEPDGITCDLCNNAQWWTDNGFTDEERHHFCGSQGIACPGF